MEKENKPVEPQPDMEDVYERHKRAFDYDPELFLEDWRKKQT